ncbi:hypothetical protein CC77DRAFT_103914 [Alternaria alternata]|jgi:hypothetical protein|uniref:Epidermal growth factor receptor-like transmembrane-juxtamembrane segment domain-containing protein n=1 Tax=Alternaria alternata TaxID=5599 RepID=A0A177DKC0_ALTAL|nr:hypothetical protein CC77DRAFT_103914 [Alternaria alternata]KAH6862097.1 hypothetical protein B0T12DRAFT_88925 [Alternaria alternata]OAG20165.1 hypothetical protein CC77DRAFT_103914 [Alternaria alternata]RYN59348.1 hypothetical protein AA0118_g6817 [Alternaria tenuissima]RYN93940.1 hypothetical protein AA0120_g4212 [Alternaria tenuissima]
MAYTKLSPLLAILLSSKYVDAAMIRAPTPAVTPAPAATAAPLAVRDITTIGYISTGMYGSTTLYETITANNEGHVIATSGSLYKICAPESLCEFFSCENDYAVFPTTSIFCGGSSSTCSYWELATDINDPAPLTNYWCDAKTETGGLILMVTPDDDSSTSPNTGSASNTPLFSSFTPVSVSDTPGSSDIPEALPPSAEVKKSKKSTPVGAIAGGVVGGVALLAAVVLGVFFLLRRKRKQQNNTTTNNNVPQPPTAPQAPPAGVQYYHEQKPVPQQQVQQMPSPPPQQQPHYGHYDPNAQQAPQFYDPNAQSAYAAQQGSYAMPEKTPAVTNPVQANPYYADNSGPVSPVPQYTPSMSPAVPANVNELPAGRT